MTRRTRRRLALTAAVATTWLACAVAGLGALADYAAKPAAVGQTPASWPSGTAVQRRPGKRTVVLFAHPRCPCTAATLEQLERARAAGAPAAADVWVMFFTPAGDPAWGRGGRLWERVGRMSWVRRMMDPDGVEAARFGAVASGHVVAYDADGRLRFAGGLTASRGHEGDAAGLDALADLLAGRAPRVERAPTYGCEMDPAGDGACPLCKEAE